MAITLNVSPSINFQFTPNGGVLAGQAIQVLKSFKFISTTSGTAADQCDLLYANTLTFVASTPQTIDLTSLLDVIGNSLSFARVKVFAIRVNSTTNGDKLTVGNSGTNEWSGTAAPLSAGGTLKVLASTATGNHGYTVLSGPNTTGFVVDSTHKTVKLDPGASAFSCDLLIAGCSV
jgi:hypothetical protein